MFLDGSAGPRARYASGMHALPLALLLLAQGAPDIDRLLELRVEGARKIEKIMAEELAAQKKKFAAGQVTREDLFETEREYLDTLLPLVAGEKALAAAKTGKAPTESQTLTYGFDVIRKIAELEAQRLELAKAAYEKGQLSKLKLSEREEASARAAVVLRSAEHVRKHEGKSSEIWILAATHKLELARVRDKHAKHQLELTRQQYEAGQLERSKLNDAKIEVVEAETDLATAELGFGLAKKMADRIADLGGR